MGTAAGYREFRRAAITGSGLLFVAALLLGLVYARDFGGYWVVMLWAAVVSPIVATLGLAILLWFGWAPGGIGVAKGDLRPSALLWLLLAIEIPWIVAWLAADVAGGGFARWWGAGGSEGPGFYLWLVRLAAGLVTYAVASAVGLLLTFVMDQKIAGAPGAERNRG